MKKTKTINIYIPFIVLFSFVFNYGCSQTTMKDRYSFVKVDENVIHNSKELDRFFSLLAKSDSQKINIVHIGDSHLQNNEISDVLRINFQNLLGNAGRGLVVPYKVAGTNSPEDISSSSLVKWMGKRNCKPLLPQSTGIGGITIESLDSTSAFTFKLPEKYAFTTMTLFFENDSKSYDLQAKDLVNGEIVNLKDFLDKKDSNVSKIKFKNPTNQVEIQSFKTAPNQTHTTILGINTENDKNGIVYHSIGVNGAEYFHYDTSEYFNEETPFLNPDLFIISLGTNEAFRKNFNEDSVRRDIDQFIKNLKKYNPEVSFLITTPANSYINQKNQNPKIKTVRDILIAYCKENNLAYWDLMGITGDAYNWKKNQLFSKDLIHFNKNGYQLQGELLYEALLNSYKEYASTK